VNAWTDGDQGLHHLIAALDRLPGLVRIRYTTSHPNDMADGLIAAHRDVEKLMPYLHLPVQSGSDRILKAMNRSHTRDSYLRLIDRVRTARPDIALSGDFITGFPGETDADCAQSLSIIDEANYAAAFSFAYSSRPGTPAASMPDHIDPQTGIERLHRLQAAVAARQHAFNRASVGKTCQILIDRRGKLPGQWLGKSPWLQSVHVIDPAIGIGDLIEVTLVAAGPNSLTGERPLKRAA
jgi:tRNA-2-methylthio-N6-dimethylallyladenosine synthase